MGDSILVIIDHVMLDHCTRVWKIEDDFGVVLSDYYAGQELQAEILQTTDRFTVVHSTAVKYPGENKVAVANIALRRGDGLLFEDLNMSVGEGELVWILGPNGSGKTSFFEMLAGWLEPSAGSFEWLDDGAKQPFWKHVSYSPQNAQSDVTEASILDEISLSLQNSRRSTGTLEAGKFLEVAGLPTELWGTAIGSDASLKKLASVLAALARGGGLCLLDEPSVCLGSKFIDILVRAAVAYLRSGGILLCATHDPHFFAAMESALAQESVRHR